MPVGQRDLPVSQKLSMGIEEEVTNKPRGEQTELDGQVYLDELVQSLLSQCQAFVINKRSSCCYLVAGWPRKSNYRTLQSLFKIC